MTNRGYKGYIGDKGEDVVRAYLQGKGYAPLAYKYRSTYGEIDIIAQDGEYTVFIEVKYRKTPAFGIPGASVNAKKRERVIKTALCYFAEQGKEAYCRFDVIEVYGYDGMRIEHIENAFCQ